MLQNSPQIGEFSQAPDWVQNRTEPPIFPILGTLSPAPECEEKEPEPIFFPSVPGGEQVGKSEAEAREGETRDPTHSQETSANIPRRDPRAPARNTGGGVTLSKAFVGPARETSHSQPAKRQKFFSRGTPGTQRAPSSGCTLGLQNVQRAAASPRPSARARATQ